MKIYIKSDSHNGYLYIFKHGLGPGTIPKDVAIVKEKDLPNGYTAVWLDRFLRTGELKAYDIPSETEINMYLDRIGYCQKDGDVVPCDKVAACDVTASTHDGSDLPTFREFATTEWELLNDGSKRLKLKDLFVYFGTDKQWNASNPGYWYEIRIGDKTYKESKKYSINNKERCYKAMQRAVSELLQSDSIESCDKVTASKSNKADILDSYLGKDTWLKAKLSQKAHFRRGYTGNEYWIKIVDKDENDNYVINRVSSYKEYKGNSTQKQKTLSNTYTVDKNSITLFNPIQTATTDEIFNVDACDKVVASTVSSSDIKLLAKEALNCSTRDELSSVIGSLLPIDKKLYLHYMEMLRDDSLSVGYIAGQLSDELMGHYSDDVEACDKITASQKHHSLIPEGWESIPEGEDDEGNWGTIAKELPNNDGYVWIDMYQDGAGKPSYHIDISYRTSEGRMGDVHPLTSKEFRSLKQALDFVEAKIAKMYESEEDVEACDKVTASKDISCYKKYADALAKQGYSKNKFLKSLKEDFTDKDLEDLINNEADLHAYITGFILNSDGRYDYIAQEEATKLADEIISDACDNITASTHRYSAGRIEDDGTEDFYYDTGFDSYDEACDWGINHDCTHIYDRERDEFAPINSCDTKYFANMVSASNDPELDDNFLIEGYYDNQRRGLAESAETSDVSALNELANEYANKGYYIVVHNLTDGVITEFSADNWFDDIARDGGATLFMSW